MSHPATILIQCPTCGKDKQIPRPAKSPVWAVRCEILCRSCWGDAKEGTVEYFSEPPSKKELASKHGTPRQFADACLCAIGMITVDEAQEAIRKYNEEWATAPDA